MEDPDTPPSKPPPPPPPKRLSRPKITLQIPDTPLQIPRGPQTASSVYWAPNRYHGKVPTTPGSHLSDPHGNPYFNPVLYHNKASEFMFKQFAGFKDFTMNTAKSGLSAGEKSAFWFYNKLRSLSKKWFTHFFLTLCLVLYSVMGAAVFMALEGPNEEKLDKNLTDVRRDFAMRVEEIWNNRHRVEKFNFVALIEADLVTYEENFTEVAKHLNDRNVIKKTWGFWNAMFYAGTIYTTIGGKTLPLIPTGYHAGYLGPPSKHSMLPHHSHAALRQILERRKTSESDMSEDQGQQAGAKRKVLPAPRRFIKNRSPRANRSQSVNRVEDEKVIDRVGTEMSQTSKDIIELMQKRARSLSIPKDDPKVPVEYKYRTLQTPNKNTPSTSRTSRGISCPKTIQIISDKQILSGLSIKKGEASSKEIPRKQSGYIDASQSEYTSSCYSSSPSENEYEFDLAERTAELTRKLKQLSQEVEHRDFMNVEQNIDFLNNNETKNVLRKRITEHKNGVQKDGRESLFQDSKVKSKSHEDKKKIMRSRWKLIANWQQFKQEHNGDYNKLLLLRNKCICELLLLVIMCGLGGMMFKSLEGSFENAYKCGTRNVKRDFIESLWRGSHYLREEDWKSMARKKLYEFEDQLHTAHEAGITSYSGLRSWSFMNSFVYCLTLITTIGYGHIAPKTTYGRVATIVYAIIGIPLFLIVLADFGKLFTRIIKFFWSFIRRFYYTRSCRKVRRTVPMQEMMKGLNIVYDVVRRPSQIFSEEDLQINPNAAQPPPIQRKPSDGPPPLPPKPGQVIDVENGTEPATPAPSVFEIDDEFNLPISVAIFILVIYIVVGALGYNMWEKWDFFESFYFVFISMSTIGLGDLVPDHPMFMMASILYLVFGLALTSMCINVVQVKLSDTFKQASAKLGATIGLQVAEEDGSLVPIPPPPTEIAPVHKPKSEREEKEKGVTKIKETNDAESKNR